MNKGVELLVICLLFLLPEVGSAQDEEAGWSDRTSLLLFYGWPKELSSAFADNQVCPSNDAREVGIGVSLDLNSFFGFELGGSRFFAHDHETCVNGHWPPQEGPYTHSYTTPTKETRGYPFSTIWAHVKVQRELVEGISGRVFGGAGFIGSKSLPFGVLGFSGEAGTLRVRLFLEYEVAWYSVRLEQVERYFMDGALIDTERRNIRDPHRSANLRLGSRILLGSGTRS